MKKLTKKEEKRKPLYQIFEEKEIEKKMKEMELNAKNKERIEKNMRKLDKKIRENNMNNMNEHYFYDLNEGEEEMKLKEMKKKIIKSQKNLRENNKNITEMTSKNKSKQINEVLENMCIYGYITKKEIEEEKKNNREKFIETSKALKLEEKDEGLFALGLISQNLENLGVKTAIEVNENLDTLEEDLTSLQFITNGMINKKRYDLHFDLGEKRNNELLTNKREYEKFKEELKSKLSKDYNIPKEEIIVTLPQKGSFRVQIIFQGYEFHNLNKKDFIEKFKNDKDFKELSNLKEIHEDIITGAVKLTRNQLDSRGNRSDGWAIGEKRGGKDYDPPLGWKGIGLRVLDKFDNGDNTWLGMTNEPGEWCVAYHGVARDQTSEKVKYVTGEICKTTFNPGKNQVHDICDDLFHPGKKVGVGVYCTPKIETAGDNYAGISVINGIKYLTVLMVRVKPEAIRNCKCYDDYWVVNGTTDEIRPYRILYKKCC